MRNLFELERWRSIPLENQIGVTADVAGQFGAFLIPSESERLRGSTLAVRIKVIASSGLGYDWDHVSVSTATRCPTWAEMEQIKRLFFEDHETAMQLHVPPADHINNHSFCLHLWRPHLVEIPRPPGIMVGVRGATPAEVRQMAAGLARENAA